MSEQGAAGQAQPADQGIGAAIDRALEALGQGEVTRARSLLKAAIALDPSHPAPRHNLAELEFRSGQLDRAQALFEELVNGWPGFLPAYPAFLALLDHRRAGAGLAPDDLRPVLLNNFGNALLAACQIPAAEGAYRRALGLRPDYVNALSNLSNALRLMGRLSEAELTARGALALQADHVGAWVNLGCALEELACHAEGEACHRRALELQADQPEALHNLGSGQLMRQLFRSDLSEAELLERHRAWGASLVARLAPAQAAFPHREPSQPPARSGKPRLGFLSSDLRRHAVTSFLEPLLEKLDRQRYEVVCFASQLESDGVSERLRQLPLEWHPCHHLNDSDLASLIQREGIDLLVELNGHTRGTRLDALAARPAPVQVSWLGYPFRTGLPTIDYRLSDGCVDNGSDPELLAAQHHAAERSMLMDRCQFVYRPASEAPDVSPLPALEASGITFGSRSNLHKLSAEVIALWSRLLLACPDSRLLLQSSQLADPLWRGRMLGAFAAHGLAPERLMLLPYDHREDQLAAYHAIDIALDPFPYNGLTTSCDALWMGVPVVTLRGEVPQGRGGVSLLEALGRPEWIADDPGAYLAIAQALAVNPVGLSAERKGLRALMEASPLRQEADHARAFERCVERMLAGPVGTDQQGGKGSHQKAPRLRSTRTTQDPRH